MKNTMKHTLVSLIAFTSLATFTLHSNAQPRFQRAVAAPVPEEVVMQRPSQAELDTLGQALEQFRRSADAQTTEILQKFPTLLEVRDLPANTAIIPNLSAGFQAKHTNNKEVAAAGNIDLLFMGDSITDFWRNETGQYAGKQVQDEYFGDWNVANFGIAGDTTQGVLFRLQNGEGEGYNPKAIMLMIGTNNTYANSSGEIAEGVGAIVLQMRNDFPDAKILLLGIFPRGKHDDAVRTTISDINDIIKNLDDGSHVFYKDIGDVLVDANGDVPANIMSDGLHPSPYGYELWAEAVIDDITRLMD